MSEAVAKRSAESERMVASAERLRALMGGTTAMRDAGTQYLPQFSAESAKTYKERLAMSWLFNGTRKTVRDMTGRVFNKTIELGDDTPPQVTEWSKNIDLAGRDISTFARQVFEDGMQAGVSYIMVDAPARNDTVTRAQAAAMNLRPFLTHLRVEDVLGWRSEAIGNVTTLTQIRIMEQVKVPDPKDEFSEIAVDQVRVLDRTDTGVQTRIYQKVKAQQGGDKWQMIDEPTFSDMTEITIIPFYANRTGFFTGEPLLDDLADVNIAHWQSQSDQRNILHFARVPILFGSGRQDDEPIKISAGQMTTALDPAAKLQWVEHSGHAIGAGRQDLKDLEFQMEMLGLQLLVARSESATGAALDAEKETSVLSMSADQLQDALEQALFWVCEYAGLNATPSVTVNKEFSVGVMTAQEMAVLLQAVQSGNMSRETFLRELARRGMVAPDLDVDDEAERIAASAPALEGEALDLNDGGE